MSVKRTKIERYLNLKKLNEIINSLYGKYQKLSLSKKLWILVIAAFALRLVFARPLLMELDTHFFARMAKDIYNNTVSGQLFKLPVNHANYYGIEYRTPLFPALAALINLVVMDIEWSLIIVSLLAGCLLVVPVYLLADRIQGSSAGTIAALLTVIHPQLIYYSIMGRSESLYVLFFTWAVYYTVIAFEKGYWKDVILTGILWGLAYLTRFEALAGAGISCLVLLYRMFDKKTSESRGLILWKAVVCGLAAGLLVLPYSIVLARTAGGIHLTSPSKQLYDLSEGLYIIQGMPGGYDSYNFQFGGPGEYDYAQLKELLGKSPSLLLKENLALVLKHTLRSIPRNIRSACSNINYFYFALLLVPFFAHWKTRDPRPAIIRCFFLPALPVILFQFWDPDPRYFAFTVPLLNIILGGIITNLIEDGKGVMVEKPFWSRIFSYVICPLSIILSWYFYLLQPLTPEYLQFDPEALSHGLHICLPVFLLIFVGTGLMSILLTLIWRRIFPAVLIPSTGLGIMIIVGSYIQNRVEKPVSLADFLYSQNMMPIRSIIIWFFALGVFLEAVYYINRHYSTPPAYQKALLLVCLLGLMGVNLQNIITLNFSNRIYREKHYNPEAEMEIVKRGTKNLSVMCAHPRDAFAVGADWIKIPPVSATYELRQYIRDKKPDYIITDNLLETFGRTRDLYPMLLVLSDEHEIDKIWEGPAGGRLGENMRISRLFAGPPKVRDELLRKKMEIQRSGRDE